MHEAAVGADVAILHVGCLRVTAQLIDGVSSAHLWAERYDRDVEDVFAVQDEIARTIATTLEGRVAASGIVAAKRKPTRELAAYDLFLRGRERDAYFDLDKADLRPDAREALTKTAEFLRNYPQAKVTIEGHCDERGSTEYNLALGDRRAAAVKQFLVSQGISADRMSTVSFGKEKPFCMESTEACWQQNRRGHFVPAH